MATNVEG